MANKTPVEKLSLAVRKNYRDKFENNKAEHESKIAQLVGTDSWTVNINANLVYAYAEESGSYPSTNFGDCVNNYINSFIDRLKDYTKNGKDEEAKEAVRKVAKQHSITLLPDEAVHYCGMNIKDGEIRLLFRPKDLGTNISDVAKGIAKAVDVALDALGENDLPVVTRRAIVASLDPAITKAQGKLKALFKEDFKLEADIGDVLKKLLAAPEAINWYKEYVNQRAAEWTALYFENAVNQLEQKKFGSDDMLQEAFLESTEKRVIRFEIVDSLKNGKTYNDTFFEDGEYKIQTTAKNFGTNVGDVGKDVVERL